MKVWKNKQSAIRDLAGFSSHISAHFYRNFLIAITFLQQFFWQISIKITYKLKI